MKWVNQIGASIGRDSRIVGRVLAVKHCKPLRSSTVLRGQVGSESATTTVAGTDAARVHRNDLEVLRGPRRIANGRIALVSLRPNEEQCGVVRAAETGERALRAIFANRLVRALAAKLGLSWQGI